MKTVALVTVMAGFLALGRIKSSWYDDRAGLLGALCAFIRLARDSIAYRALPPDGIVREALKRQDLKTISFVRSLSRANIAEIGFLSPWSRALSTLPLTEEEKELLTDWGASLGRSDGESQIVSCDAALARLSGMWEEASKEASKQGRMWVSLGALGGAFAVIMLI